MTNEPMSSSNFTTQNSLPFHHLQRQVNWNMFNQKWEMQTFFKSHLSKSKNSTQHSQRGEKKSGEILFQKRTVGKLRNGRHTCSTALSWRSIDKDSSPILSFWQTVSIQKRKRESISRKIPQPINKKGEKKNFTEQCVEMKLRV